MLFVFALFTAAATPAEFAVQNAQTEIVAHADYAAGYAHLAMAWTRRVRETGDQSYLERAEESVTKALSLAPGDFEARKAEAAILLARHDWGRALDLAKTLNRQTPDDVSIYGYMADAQIALGDFGGAVENAGWMLRLRPGNSAGMIRAGRLREIYGDMPGAVEAFRMAYDTTAFAESEERAWILVQIARIERESGDAKAAESATKDALAAFPGYYLAAR
jgi:tetratricopeptide (TPR) repeat protein